MPATNKHWLIKCSCQKLKANRQLLITLKTNVWKNL
jgi:hypothetical protein